MAAVKGKSSGIWGLELSEDRLRLVHISPRRNGCELNCAVRITLEPDISDQDIAKLIVRAMEGSDINCRVVALCLAGADGDVLSEMPVSSDKAEEDFASVNVAIGDKRSIVVRGRISAAQRLVEIASLAGLEVRCILPTQAALALSGDLFESTPRKKKARSDTGSRVTVFVGTTRIIMMLVSDRAISRCRIAPRKFATDRYDHDVRTAIKQFFAAISSSKDVANGSWPRSCDVYADGLSAEELRGLSDNLAVSCRACTPAMNHGMIIAAEYSSGVASYSAGIGACMSGLGISPVKIDLSDEILAAGHRRETRLDSGRLWSVAIVALVILAVGFLLYNRVKQKIELSALESRYQEIQPMLAQASKLEDQWARVQPWLSTNEQGTRSRYLEMLNAIIELFPDPQYAYVTDMQMDLKPEGDIAIDIKGRCVGSEVLHECVSRLNESGKFQALLGTVSDVEQSRDYPKKYSITIALAKQVEDAGKP